MMTTTYLPVILVLAISSVAGMFPKYYKPNSAHRAYKHAAMKGTNFMPFGSMYSKYLPISAYSPSGKMMAKKGQKTTVKGSQIIHISVNKKQKGYPPVPIPSPVPPKMNKNRGKMSKQGEKLMGTSGKVNGLVGNPVSAAPPNLLTQITNQLTRLQTKESQLATNAAPVTQQLVPGIGQSGALSSLMTPPLPPSSPFASPLASPLIAQLLSPAPQGGWILAQLLRQQQATAAFERQLELLAAIQGVQPASSTAYLILQQLLQSLLGGQMGQQSSPNQFLLMRVQQVLQSLRQSSQSIQNQQLSNILSGGPGQVTQLIEILETLGELQQSLPLLTSQLGGTGPLQNLLGAGGSPLQNLLGAGGSPLQNLLGAGGLGGNTPLDTAPLGLSQLANTGIGGDPNMFLPGQPPFELSGLSGNPRAQPDLAPLTQTSSLQNLGSSGSLGTLSPIGQSAQPDQLTDLLSAIGAQGTIPGQGMAFGQGAEFEQGVAMGQGIAGQQPGLETPLLPGEQMSSMGQGTFSGQMQQPM